MAADYLLSGKKWSGPREGVNIAGYGAWALGFLVGILPFLPVSDGLRTAAQPAVVYSLSTGFVVYTLLAKLGFEPAPVSGYEKKVAWVGKV
jgi:cytosine permease